MTLPLAVKEEMWTLLMSQFPRCYKGLVCIKGYILSDAMRRISLEQQLMEHWVKRKY